MSTTFTLHGASGAPSIVFDNGSAADANGSHWYLTGITGWDGNPPVRAGALQSSGRHGSIALPSTYGPRPVAIQGVCKSPSLTVAQAARDLLGGVTNSLLNVNGRLACSGEGVERMLYVRLNAPVQMEQVNPTRGFAFQIGLLAYQPRKFSIEEETYTKAAGAGPVVVPFENEGNINTFPVVNVTSAGTLWVGNNDTGEYLHVMTGSSIPAGAILDFNIRNAYAFQASYNNLLTAASQWWTMPPGTTNVRLDGSAAFTFTYRHAWIN